jgi:hypothetical protein
LLCPGWQSNKQHAETQPVKGMEKPKSRSHEKPPSRRELLQSIEVLARFAWRVAQLFFSAMIFCTNIVVEVEAWG